VAAPSPCRWSRTCSCGHRGATCARRWEIPLAYAIETLWTKRRIIEIYLNIAEWGPGVFGAEAAARFHFRKSALLLTPREATLLAVSLPNPFERQAGRPGPGTVRLAENLLLRMKAAQASTACVRTRGSARRMAAERVDAHRIAARGEMRIGAGQSQGMPL
jgi:membrane peptidoglycan carboxypeptidase